jgi:hypothetical protein
MFAIDGCKLPSNASKEWSGTIEELTKKKKDWEELAAKLIEQHIVLDKQAEQESPLNAACHAYVYDSDYHKKHIERIQKKLEKINDFLKDAGPRTGASGEEVKSNVIDNESALIKGPHGYVQGYNGIAVVDSANQVIISAEAFGSGSETEHFPAMLDTLKGTMEELTGEEKPLAHAILTGDTGYFSEDNLQAAARAEVEVLIPDQQFRKRDPHFEGHGGKGRFTREAFTHNKDENSYTCPNGKTLVYKGHVQLNRNSGDKYQAKSADCKICPLLEKCIASRGGGKNPLRTLYIADAKYEENLSDKMKEKIDDPVYRTLYGRRMQIVEPCFSDITYCKGMDRFTLRGKIKVTAQWLLYCIVHNIGKCVPRLEEVYGTGGI